MPVTSTTITVDSLPIASTIDPSNDRLLIYTASASDIQGISRNVLLGLASQPLGLTDTQSPTNKTFNNTNSFTVTTANLTIQDSSDNTKQGTFSLSGNTTGTTRVYTLPNYNATLASLSGTETLTNKTLTSPVTTGISNTGGLSTNAITVTGAATVGTTLGVTTNTTIGGTLAVTGTSTFTGALGGAGYSIGTISNPYKFSVYLAGSQNTATGSPARVLFDTKIFDTSSNVDVATNKGRFTAPVAGFYCFSSTLNVVLNGSAGLQLLLYKNGSLYAELSSVSNQSALNTYGSATSGSTIVSLSANDYIEVFNLCTGSTAITTGSNFTFFTGFLVSAT